MIGFDLQEVKKIKNEDGLLNKIALQSEIDYVNTFAKGKKEKTAALWAVKEAVFKALDTSSGEISFKEIELCHKQNGAPFIKLYGKAKQLFDRQFKKISISLSHQKNVVGAVVICE